MKVIAVTQARIGSSRLPNKVLLEVNGKTLLQIHLERILKSKKINKLIVATTTEKGVEKIEDIARKIGCQSYKGSLNDVLDRFYQAVKNDTPDLVVRLTSDCPLIDPELIDDAINECIKGGYDYCSNSLEPSYPDGMDVEVFKFSALEKAWKEATLASEREHVTPFIWKNSTFKGGNLFKSRNIRSNEDYSSYRLTVDESADFSLISHLINAIGDDKNWKEYVGYLRLHPELTNINASIKRNQGYMKSIQQDKVQVPQITNFSKSDKYRNKIHTLIPGGAHTYSKGDDQFPALAPAAISHGKGAYLWDVDGNKFLDCSMGLSTVSLGHAYEPVLEKVRAELEKGVNFQRPSVIEMEMAEKFLSLVPQHQMIKFAKNGSTATTAAVKLARAYTGRDLIAFPAEHPFYSYDDWFIGKTACDLGVPGAFGQLSVTYKADDLNSLKELFEKYPGKIAGVISEPEKNWGIPEGYLKNAIDLAHKNGAVYIADEMVTGFKTALPGSIKKYNVEPDIATWGKGIANGFSFCALTGKKDIMKIGGIIDKGTEKVFLISTTHGGETHAIAAGLATIHEFETKNVIAHNHGLGNYMNKLGAQLLSTHNLNEYIEMAPSDWMPVFVFRDKNKEVSAGLRTLVMQEMIKRGVLFQGSFVPCLSHTKADVEYFIEAMDASLQVYKKALEDSFEKYLVGEPAKPVFRKIL